MRALLVSAVLLSLAASGARADSVGAGGASAEARLRQAELLAKKKELEPAAAIYRALLEEGRDGADLRYNLGTLCLELGDLGCAVLHLRVAARIDPRDDDVQHNLGVALEARTDRLAGSAVVDPVRALGARVPPLLARLALAVPLALLGIALAFLALGRVRSVARALALLAAAAAVIGAAVYASRLAVERAVEAVVVVPETPALKEPDAAAAVAFTAHAGLHGDVVDRAPEGLLRLRFDNGLEAWINERDTAVVR